MNTFLWLDDYQWSAISSIATTVGVLLALFIPLAKRRREKKNLLYFEAKTLRTLLDDIKYVHNYHVATSDRAEKLYALARQYLSIEIPNMDGTKELAKYDIKLYEAISGIVEELQMVHVSAEQFLNSSKNSLYFELDCAKFESSTAGLELKVIFSTDYLAKKKVVGKYWTSI